MVKGVVYGGWQLFMSGCPLMWPILFCSVVACAIIVEKMCMNG